MTARLLLIRHGESEGNAAGILQGHRDYPLTPRGLRQAHLAAAQVAHLGVDRMVTSPLARAVQTADVIARAVRRPAEPHPGLAEYDIGEAAGLTLAEIRARFPGIIEAQRRGDPVRFPGEEGRAAFAERIRSALEELTAGGTVVAVTHGGVVSAICHLVLGLDLGRRGSFRVANCSITEIVRDPRGRFVLERHNDTCHLDAPEMVAKFG